MTYAETLIKNIERDLASLKTELQKNRIPVKNQKEKEDEEYAQAVWATSEIRL